MSNLNARPKLVSSKYLTLHGIFLVPLLEKYFDWEFVSNKNYSTHDCYYTDRLDDSIAQDWADQGRKVVFDCLWEPHIDIDPNYPCHTLKNWNWLWYQESIWYKHLQYHTYVPNRDWHYHAFMPIRKKRPARDWAISYLGNQLHRFLWSYQEQGRHLPNDGDPNDWSNQRLFRPEWYDSTSMSLVLETKVELNGTDTPLLSEKTFKPIAFRHPFVICGDLFTLDRLHYLGFETFENIFDENYDTITSWTTRCSNAIEQCLQFEPLANQYDAITQQKLDHNHAHFFDQTLVEQKIKDEIFEPLLNYAET